MAQKLYRICRAPQFILWVLLAQTGVNTASVDYGAPNCFKVLVAAECILLLTYGTYLVARQNESTKQCAYVQLRIAEKAETN